MQSDNQRSLAIKVIEVNHCALSCDSLYAKANYEKRAVLFFSIRPFHQSHFQLWYTDYLLFMRQALDSSSWHKSSFQPTNPQETPIPKIEFPRFDKCFLFLLKKWPFINIYICRSSHAGLPIESQWYMTKWSSSRRRLWTRFCCYCQVEDALTSTIKKDKIQFV